MKYQLIFQSFLPLYVLLFIKNFKLEYFYLIYKFIKWFKLDFSFIKYVIKHHYFISIISEILLLFMIVLAFKFYNDFKKENDSGFISQGEKIKDVKDLSENNLLFFVTYILPLGAGKLCTINDLLFLIAIMFFVFVLLGKTNIYYENPILTMMGYKIFSFNFVASADLKKSKYHEYIGITYGIKIVNDLNNQNIRRKHICDNVYIIYKDR